MPDVMHCQDELLQDMETGWEHGFVSDHTMLKWFNDRYSTSKHLLTLYSIARGLDAQNIVEVGFGRSSFVLARAAHENGGRFFTCDHRDFRYLLSEQEKSVTEYVLKKSDILWDTLIQNHIKIDFAFLDYFSGEGLHYSFCDQEITKCKQLMDDNGIIAIHDTIVSKYVISNYAPICAGCVILPYNYGLTLINPYMNTEKWASDKFVKKKEDT